MQSEGTLYWITGLSGAGKTTIGNRLFYELKRENSNVVLLDGDVLKNIVSEVVDYTYDGRKRRAMQYAKICQMLTNQGIIVICCTIAMYDKVREWNRKNNKKYVEVFLDVPFEVLKMRDQKGLYSSYADGQIKNLIGGDIEVEYPKTPDIVVCNDGRETIQNIVNIIKNYKVDNQSDFDRDTEYWNDYYSKKVAPLVPSLFAEWVQEQLISGKTLLELGCGNGRDSLYFYQQGINVTAVDASPKTIEDLKRNNTEDNIYFICDDFVCAPTIFSGEYDYCYSRFSLHALNEEQEKEVIENVYKVLKKEGKFFIETRGIHDELYGKGKQIGRNAFFYNGHFRRFVEKNELLNTLKQVGFYIDYENESRGFAPFGDEDPMVIRIVAHK